MTAKGMAGLCLMLLGSSAEADGLADQVWLASSSRDSVAELREASRLKSPTTAALVSLGATILLPAAALIAQDDLGAAVTATAGAIVGPSMGYFYAGCERDGWRGMGIRAGIGVISGAVAVRAAWTPTESGDDWANGFLIPLMVGGALIAGDAAYDIATAPRRVRRHNQKITGPRVEIRPNTRSGGVTFAIRTTF